MSSTNNVYFISKPIKYNPLKAAFTWSRLFLLLNLSLAGIILIPPVNSSVKSMVQLAMIPTRVEAWTAPGGVELDLEQQKVVNAIIKAGKDLKMSDRDIQMGIAAAQQESGLRNLDHGDDWFFKETGGGKSDSIGILQQRNMKPWNNRDRKDPYQAAYSFFEQLKEVPDRDNLEPWQAISEVQKPAKEYQQHYAQWDKMAKEIYAAKVPGFKLGGLNLSLPGFFKQDRGWIAPISGAEITSPYGMRIHPITKQWKMHNGIDYGAGLNSPTLATRSGKVLYSGDDNDGYGIKVIIQHSEGYESLYAHLDKTLVTVGQEVKQGDIIGEAGSTGNSTGLHSHFEVRLNGDLIDPQTLVK